MSTPHWVYIGQLTDEERARIRLLRDVLMRVIEAKTRYRRTMRRKIRRYARTLHVETL